MWKTQYKTKMKITSIILVLCFLTLIGATLSRVGVVAMNEKDYYNSRDAFGRISENKAYYEQILGDVYDTKGKPILVNDTVIDSSCLNYHKSYSHLLGNIHLVDNGLLNRNFKVLTDKKAHDIVDNKGYSLSLTLNDDLQKFTYSLTQGKRASIVVIKRHSGEILALTSTYEEDFDLSGELNEDKLSQYNSASESIWLPEYLNSYPPGSCQKVFSSAVAYETGMENYTINDTGSISYDGAKISNSGGAVYGNNLNISDAFCVSSNTYFASLFNNTETGVIRKLSSDLLLNSSIETDFGTIKNYFSFNEYTDFEIGLMGIGQKNELSCVGMAFMVQGCIDNEIYRPHVIKNTCITDKNGYNVVIDSTQEEILASGMLSDNTCSNIRLLMETAAKSDAYLLSDNILGAKSGTAEIIIDGVYTDRASLVSYNENYIAVVSKIESGSFGISNKDVMEKIFKKLSDIDSDVCASPKEL